MTDTVALRQPWYRGLNRHQWNILLAANLGWLFDGFELYALILTVGPAMRSLLDPSQYPQIPAYIGTVVAITHFMSEVPQPYIRPSTTLLGRLSAAGTVSVWPANRTRDGRPRFVRASTASPLRITSKCGAWARSAT